MTKHTKSWTRRSLVAVTLLAALYAIAVMVGSRLIRGRLQKLADDRLLATLRMNHVLYFPPYSVRIWGLQLNADAHGESVELLNIERLGLRLAEFPHKNRPLVFQNFSITNPSIKLVQSADGWVGGKGMVKPNKQQDEKSSRKLSDMLRLRKFAIDGGTVVYEDRRRQTNTPVQWKNIHVDLQTESQGVANYAYQLKVRDEPLAMLDSSGEMNIDDLVIHAQQLALTVQAGGTQRETQLPAAVQEFLEKRGVKGKVSVTGSGRSALKDAGDSTFDAEVELSDGAVRIPKWEMELQHVGIKIRCSCQRRGTITTNPVEPATVPAAPEVRAELISASAAVDGAALSISGGRALLQPDGVLLVQDLRGTYGKDKLMVKSARIPMQTEPDAFAIQEIDGSVEFQPPSPKYPPKLQKALDQLRPSGHFLVVGGAAFRKDGEKRSKSYRLFLSSDDGVFRVTNKQVPITNLRGDAVCTETGMDVTQLRGNVLGGVVETKGRLTRGRPWTFDGEVSVQEIQLEQLAGYTVRPDSNAARKMTGRGFLNAHLSGTLGKGPDGTPTDAQSLQARAWHDLQAQGEFEVLEGDFWDDPVLKAVVGKTKVQREKLGAADAAGIFIVRNEVIDLQNAAVNGPVLGLQGSGQVSFKGELDLTVLAALLADWKADIKRTGIPIVSNVAGEVLGGIQKLLNSATKTLLYECKVTGYVHEPQVTTVPTPVLSEPIAGLFGTMLKGEKDHKLLEAVRQKK